MYLDLNSKGDSDHGEEARRQEGRKERNAQEGNAQEVVAAAAPSPKEIAMAGMKGSVQAGTKIGGGSKRGPGLSLKTDMKNLVGAKTAPKAARKRV